MLGKPCLWVAIAPAAYPVRPRVEATVEAGPAEPDSHLGFGALD